ncbi:hypothetical protein ACFFRR_000358 [Megaselia abdita]
MDKLRILLRSWIIFGVLLAIGSTEIVLRVDPLALLSQTLRTYQRAACDTDQVALSCPRGTSISIEFAQYNKFNERGDGVTIEDLCPLNGGNSERSIEAKMKTNRQLLNGSTFAIAGGILKQMQSANFPNGSHIYYDTTNTSSGGPPGKDNLANELNIPENCLWPNALQYSLLQTVVEACQKKKHCKFNAIPEFYGLGRSGVGIASSGNGASSNTSNDQSGTTTTSTTVTSASSSSTTTTTSASNTSSEPCPRIRKIVEISYKCRPYEFRSKVACENDIAQIECNPYSRIAVYSASFGRTEYESIQCPQPQGVKEETCLATYATETVMQICHGRRKCNIAADPNTFGRPCHKNSRMYLKVVYTCVPKQVLKQRFESEEEQDENDDFEGDVNDLYDEQFYKESEAIPKLQSNVTSSREIMGNNNQLVNSSNSTGETSTSVNPVMTHTADHTLAGEQEHLYFYLIIAATFGVSLCVVIVAIRVILHKRNTSGSSGTDGNESGSSTKGETTIPNGFNDTISEIDADIDLTTPIPVPSVSKNENYVNYGPKSSLYGSLGPSNVSHTSSTMLIPTTNTMMCGPPRQSPDIIGISSTFTQPPMGLGTKPTLYGPPQPQPPVSMIGMLGGINGQSSYSCSSAMGGAIVPMTSYTSAPTYRTTSGYLMDPEGVLRRPISTLTPPPPMSIQQQQQANINVNSMPTPVPAPPPALHPMMYTLSTGGIPANSQYYYG